MTEHSITNHAVISFSSQCLYVKTAHLVDYDIKLTSSAI